MTRRLIRCLAAGKVQGVGYRWFACSKARELHLSGAVRNLRTGEVEIWFQGDPVRVDAYLVQLRRGPAGAQVANLEIIEPEESADYPDPFTIMPTV